jgi:hypothetical protein
MNCAKCGNKNAMIRRLAKAESLKLGYTRNPRIYMLLGIY